jgi:hypothetical protein
MKQLLSFQLTFSQKSTGPSTEATLCTTVSSSMSSSTDIGCKDVSKPPAHNDNPFIGTNAAIQLQFDTVKETQLKRLH